MGKDQVMVCSSPDEANKILDQVYNANQGGTPLGFMTDNGEIQLANIYPKLDIPKKLNSQADFNYRIKKSADAYIQELSYGRG
ncbi:MAG: hypothetical protein EOO69_09445 [Moraxellaceae bacterium]|nr:MAG: hypothetical protein EOO69_09445 [Moraxellaceae bacterium]